MNRYEVRGHKGVFADLEGSYVFYKDAAAIEAERDALRKRVLDLEVEIAEWTQAGHAGWWAKKCGQAEAERDALKAENERLRRDMVSIRTAISAAIAVNMKPGNKPWSTQHWCEFVVDLVPEPKALGEGR